MIVSALLTSVGINFGLCVLYFTLYSILRKQPGNIHVYAPRLVAEGKSQKKTHFNIDRLLPSTGWVKRAWTLTEDEIMSVSGLDGVVFLRIITFSLKIFAFAGVVGTFILLPINYFGDQLSISDFSDLTKKSLDSFSISNVNNGSKRLWVHFCAVYALTGYVCFLLYHEYKYISSKRIASFCASELRPDQFTILVRGRSSSMESPFSDGVESFFTEYYASSYLSHFVVHRTSKLQGHISDAKKLYKKLTQLRSSNEGRHKFQRDGFLGLFGRKVDLVDNCEKKLEHLEENVRMGQSDSSLSGQEVSAAFVSFKSRVAAAIALHFQQSNDPTEWITEQAPEPRDVYWPFFSASFVQRWLWKFVVIVASTLLTLLFLIPVIFVQGLANLNQLETYLPFLKAVLTITIVTDLITGYLPSLILQLFLSFIPPIMKTFSSMQGYISHSEIEKSACSKVLLFTIWNIFFANTLSGSAFSLFNILLEPKNIIYRLAVAVPAQASFFISYVVTSGWTSLSSELFRMKPLVFDYINCSKIADEDFEAPSISYHSKIPKILFFGLLGITYFFLAPLILPFLLAYYCLGYIIYRNQILNVYVPKYETGGKFWPIVHSSTIFSLVLMQALAIGIFGLKKLPLAAGFTVPLLPITLLFNEYCRKRFLPIFKAYSLESLIKKDRDGENDPRMADFLDELVTAYKDPALKPVQYSRNTNEHSAPLLGEA
ncbi:hypothetical protein GIB67_007289 [Kingdonia uniflora]|uniref:CSC1-like protein HYP1 n=1 Tax=Kingdonia uniflora TaxID=39325 RepID=A0A7J7NXX8_9MAGN|nr:hypothetical protein GIB67_007289 [Kingdonia uniflora]